MGDLIGHRLSGDEGTAEVSLHCVAQPPSVADNHRVVQSPFLSDLFDELSILLSFDRDQCVDGVAR